MARERWIIRAVEATETRVGGSPTLANKISRQGPDEDLQGTDSKTPMDGSILHKPQGPREGATGPVLESRQPTRAPHT